jgi:uncharacterized membrane protein
MIDTKIRRRDTALAHVATAILVGVVAAVGAGVGGQWRLAALIGWDAAALTYLAWTWAKVGRLNADDTKAHARRHDPTRSGSDLLLLSTAVASLAAVGIVIVHAAHATGALKAWATILGIGSVVIAWLVVHTTYTLRYVRLYYDDPIGGIDFNSAEHPDYGDFAYVAFTIGMTFQVSDTSLTSRPIRRTALRHALLSYLYGTAIIATAINIVAGLTK